MRRPASLTNSGRGISPAAIRSEVFETSHRGSRLRGRRQWGVAHPLASAEDAASSRSTRYNTFPRLVIGSVERMSMVRGTL